MNILQLATIRIQCTQQTGTGLLFFPGPDLDYVYVFTAKHCLGGETFEHILLDKILNPATGEYHSYRLTETDVIRVSGDTEDLALIIIPKGRILELTGTEFYCQVINTARDIREYEVRGYTGFNEQESDRPFNLRYQEDRKENHRLFTLHSDLNLDTLFRRALQNVKGISGAGVFALCNGKYYLTGIIQEYEDGNIFVATKVLAYNALIDQTKFTLLEVVKPEADPLVLDTYNRIEFNREQIDRRTRDQVGKIHIPRDIDIPLEMLKKFCLSVIYGKAGVGKSALAKFLVRRLREQGVTVLTFTPEHLYCDSLPEALKKAGYSASMEAILSSPLAGDRVVIWIESFEKLMESDYSEAFQELLGLVHTRTHVGLLLTIRDYLMQKFKISFRFELPEGEFYYPLDVFSGQEMQQVRESMPEISPLLNNPKIYELLRNPYYLDKAARILPELLKHKRLDEVSFKNLMWTHIIDADNQQRGEVFFRTCLKRAREMSLYTSSSESAEMLAELVRDNLLQGEQSDTGYRYSPSHDILEDWALTRYIQEKYQEAESPLSFISTLEQSPAITRAFRIWLDKFYRTQPDQSAAFVQQILLDGNTQQHWKDVLLTATLRSEHAGILLDTLKGNMLEENGKLLRKLINLLQTGCKTFAQNGKNFDRLVPVGSGWDYLISFIKQNLTIILSFNGFEFEYLDLIESWSKQLPEFNPKSLPKAAADAAFLLEDFLFRYQQHFRSRFVHNRDDPYQKKYLDILFKLTGAAPDMVAQLLKAATEIDNEHPRWTGKGLLKNVRYYATSGILADQLCKYFPSEVIRIAEEDWEEEAQEEDYRGSRSHELLEITDFGINKQLEYELDAASGYQTFLYWMLLHHPDLALDFLLPFLSRAFEHNRRIYLALGKKVSEVPVTFSDGKIMTYLGSRDDWDMYRGIHPQNKLICSLLMALEKELLDMAGGDQADASKAELLMNRLINESGNVAVLGLVVSVLQAFPALLNELSVQLFGVKDFYFFDIARSNAEMRPPSYIHDDPLLKSERVMEDKRPHRLKYYQGMVGFVAQYMFLYGKHNPQLFALVDAMWDAHGNTQDYWRKYLYDMDARRYAPVRIEEPGKQQQVQILPRYDPKVMELIDSHPVESVPAANSIWARQVFEGEAVADKTYAVWKTGYNYLNTNTGLLRLLTSPGTLASIGLRDFISELNQEELSWCREELFRYAENQLAPRNYMDLSRLATDVPEAMMGLSLLLRGKPEETVALRTRTLIFRLLVAPLQDRDAAGLTEGMTRYLGESHPEFLRDCWYGLLSLADHKAQAAEERASYREQGYLPYPELGEPDAQWMEELTRSVAEGRIASPAEIRPKLTHATQWLMNDALRIIPRETTLPAHQDFIQQLLRLHIADLNVTSYRNGSDYFESRLLFRQFYALYLLAQPQEQAVVLFNELLEMTLRREDDPYTTKAIEFIYELIQEHIRAVNKGASRENFWALWEQLRTFIEKQGKAYLIPLVLMGIDWQERAEQWFVLDGKLLFYQDFITRYGGNHLDVSLKFIAGIAFRNFMPDSIRWVKKLLSQGKFMFDDLLVERFILKAFYNYGLQIKGDKTLLADFLFILEVMIIKRSAKAFMLKEEMIQYK